MVGWPAVAMEHVVRVPASPTAPHRHLPSATPSPPGPYLWAASSPAQPHACPRNPPTRAAAHWVMAPCDWVDGDLTQSGGGPGFNVLASRRHSLARPCRCPVPLLRQTKHSDAECAATSTPGPFAWQTAGPEGEQREGNLSTDGRYKNKTHALARRPSLASLSRNAAAPKQSFLDHPRQNSAPGSVQAAKLNGSRKGPDSQSVTKRLQTELMTLMTSPAPGVSAFPSADGNLLSWTATIEGPDDTPYAGLTFKLSFAFPSNYPYAAPTVLFKTPIYHPNVDFSGRICLDILKDKWTAAYNIQTVLLSLQSLLGEPNNASPLNGEAAELWDKDPQEFKTKVLARHRDVEDE
ncbi:hypothetical protein PCL_10252 [Purpureocillium lilacinum]|uniref:Ubiquitin-conjugating enzyme E2 2 n=1 Tax=Purpureocillium lilacinum TaxID=33203 RepID=A0A2U3EFD6_PURLI|nr:hypothetical protein PCL_10252 [Purpureocillium lilacinum]